MIFFVHRSQIRKQTNTLPRKISFSIAVARRTSRTAICPVSSPGLLGKNISSIRKSLKVTRYSITVFLKLANLLRNSLIKIRISFFMGDKMAEDKYAWQDKTFGLWSKTGFRGTVWAVVSAGKTIMGMKCIKKYLEFFPLDRVWVVANSREVVSQWKETCKDIPDIEYFTYLGAVSRFEKLRREGKERFYPQLLVLDECHSVMAKESGRVLDYGVKHILAMSGTPNGSDRKIGPIFQHIDYDQANIADTTIHMTSFEPTQEEARKYER